MARRQTLVQLSDELLALLDERAAKNGESRSALIRRAVERELRDEREAEIDREIIEAFAKFPDGELDAWAEAALRRSIADEPW